MQLDLLGHADERGAEFSPCRKYRYKLWRGWEQDWQSNCIAYIGLNPSTADESLNDPTVERCQRRAQQLGYSGMYMLNIFGYRATDPGDMKAQVEPVGEGDDTAILEVCRKAKQIVCCWGNHGSHLSRSDTVRLMLQAFSDKLYAIEVNASGEPKHPLYCSYEQELKPYSIGVLSDEARVLSLWQPWASFVADGYKKVETRSWSTKYRGKLLIHAAKKCYSPDSQAAEIAKQVIGRIGALPDQSARYVGAEQGFGLPLGQIIAMCDLADCIEMTPGYIDNQVALEKMTGDWRVGRYAWVLKNVEPVEPVNFVGRQGLVKAPSDLVQRLTSGQK